MDSVHDTEMENINTDIDANAGADGRNEPNLDRSFSVDDKSNSKVSLFLSIILWILVIYGVIMSTYAVFAINSTKTTCSCSTADVESALTALNIGIPTAATSSSPTQSPTAFPSAAPSKYPSKAPSKSPTTFPSVGPSASPSKPPSKYPTVPPSHNPTVEPTLVPSLEPTTSEPSSMPTSVPTSMPTMPIIYGWADKASGGDQQFPDGAGVTISFQNIREGNDANMLDTTTNEGRFTAPISGLYLFTVAVYSDAEPTAHIWYTYNGSQQGSFTSLSPALAGYEECLWSGTVIIRIIQNDYVEFQFYEPNTGGTITIYENWLHTYVKWTLVQAFD